MRESVERNLRLIPLHEVLAAASPWIAVFVLFTRSRFGLDGAVQLAGLYYLFVVAFEVPLGWLSDRVGRVATLKLAAVAWVAAFSCWLIGNDVFVIVVFGQAFLALGYAALSGTDVSFHYDTLEAVGRQGEFADRQSSVAARGKVAAAAGALGGGALGLVDLRLAFVAALLLAVAQLVVAFQLVEPPRLREHVGAGQVRVSLNYLRNGPLAWIFGYGIVMVVLEHVAFTLLQPWLTEALEQSVADLGSTPVVSGAVVATTALVGSLFARSAASLGRRFGVRQVLVGLGVLSASIVTAMALTTSLMVLVLIALRSAQGSAGTILIANAANQSVAVEHRATFLSLDSLGGRLTYGSLLLTISAGTTGDIGTALVPLTVVSWVLVVILGATALLAHRRFGADQSLSVEALRG